jgi:hypothetical protein
MDTLLLSGACGAGKSTMLQLGYRAWHAAFGATATFDTDTLLMMVDPRWELTHEERRLGLLFEQCGLLAASFQRAGFDGVVIGGNALHTPEEINPLIEQLLDAGGVAHVTLDPSLEEIERRVEARGGDKTPEWLASHVSWMRERYAPWTCRIDNSTLTPEETLGEIVARTRSGEGRITSPLPIGSQGQK